MKKVSNDMRWFVEMLFLYTSNYPYTLKQGAWVRPSVFSIQLFSFFLNPYMDEGVENPEEKNLLFCNVFLLYYIIIYINIYRYIDSI